MSTDRTHPSRPLVALVAAASLFAAAVAVRPAHADPHGYHGPFRGPGFHDHYRYEPRFLYRDPYVSSIPFQASLVLHHGLRFYFGGGLWYWNDRPGRFAIVAPPLGIVAPGLPPGYATVWVGATPYYVAGNTYYQQVPQGYAVVPAPATAAPTAPAPVASAPPAQTASADRLIVYPRQGQSEAQQAADRGQCEQWATDQSGFDPRYGLPDGDAMAGQKRGDYRRAIDACMDGRGYTVR